MEAKRAGIHYQERKGIPVKESSPQEDNGTALEQIRGFNLTKAIQF